MKTQRQVVDGIGRLAERSARTASGVYDKNVAQPIVGALTGAANFDEALATLDATLFAGIDTGDAANDMADTLVQSEMIGRAAGRMATGNRQQERRQQAVGNRPSA